MVEESTTTSDTGFRDEGWEPRKREVLFADFLIQFAQNI
jgi:hypothetical protein